MSLGLPNYRRVMDLRPATENSKWTQGLYKGIAFESGVFRMLIPILYWILNSDRALCFLRLTSSSGVSVSISGNLDSNFIYELSNTSHSPFAHFPIVFPSDSSFSTEFPRVFHSVIASFQLS